jgi:predicted nucleic acid-binding protein
MTCLSCLADDLTPLILDTSVLINLHACSYGEQILAAIPNEILVSDVVVRELNHETSHTNGENQFIRGLISHAVVTEIHLNDQSYEVYENLICGPSSLDDGEAATIAAAANLGFIPVIDERKGRARSKTLSGAKAAAWSLDLLLHRSVQTELGFSEYTKAIYLALHEGRMRIDEERCDAVVKLIGIERAIRCTSLPGFKTRSKGWRALL